MEIQDGDILAGRFSSGVRQTAVSQSVEGRAASQISTDTKIQTEAFIVIFSSSPVFPFGCLC